MNFLDLWQQELGFDFNRRLEDLELNLVSDHEDFVYVDGEEGDHGTIRYRDDSGQVVAIKEVEGGDVSSLTITDYGKPIVKAALTELFKQTLDDKLS